MNQQERISLAKDLTFDMSGKSDDELWSLVEEECRRTTPAWRAYEKLRSRYARMGRRLGALRAELRKERKMLLDLLLEEGRIAKSEYDKQIHELALLSEEGGP